MTKKIIISNLEYKNYMADICRQITNSNWRPDYIVGISRGGLMPAVMISHYLDIPMRPLQVSLRDNVECVSDLGMAEDAMGKDSKAKNILLVDDINDSGATFNWIIDDWQKGCRPSDNGWRQVWNDNVRFAVVVDNLASKCLASMDYVGFELDKSQEDVWIEFPYERWWKD